ncbi:ABC transporter substrate-binding protein [Paenibacillus beijingensis]|uniref:Sugar ABC transporter substrate-binding protein n=1 Tax=Paenibacillus beijingensis TaxID=1126833 RepID=A0A0D5NP26_9BACL|nr:extracellular solute-binding protein [Paenibacillus beijingensis]AJY76915.1 sugar ABC transporter substrate-binding protein [Paenibacillus beijingensis]
MKRKSVMLVIALLLAVSALLSACGGNSGGNTANTGTNSGGSTGTTTTTEEKTEGQPAAAEAEPFSMTLRHTQVGESKKFRLALLEDVVKKTEAEVPGLKIEFDPVEDAANRFTKLPAEMTAGNPPQIFDLFGGSADAVKYAKAGRLLDLTPILDELGIKDKFIDLSQFTVDGKIYGLPIGASQEGFFYNKPLFEKFGLKVPTTLEELETLMETLKQNNVAPIAMASKAAWVPLMLNNTLMARYAGPDTFTGFVDGSKKWNAPEVVAAWTKYNEWLAKGYFMKGELGFDYPEMRNQLITGKAGLMFDGSWASSVFADPAQAGDMVGKVGYFAVPAVANGTGDQTFVNGNHSNGYGFSANLKENEVAAVKAFIKNMYNEEMQLRGLKEDNLLPSMKVEGDMASIVQDPTLKEVLSVQAKAAGAFPVFDAFVQSDVYKEVELGISQLIAGKGKADPQKILDKIQSVQDAANQK